MDRQINPLTSLRGIAAVIVVIHHFAYYLIPTAGDKLFPRSDFFRSGYLCVDFFFILSGFILTHVYGKNWRSGVKMSDYWRFMRSRFARIYPLHLFVLLLFVGLEFVKLGLLDLPAFTGKFNLLALFANLSLLQGFALTCPPLFACDTYWNEPAWSISIEFVIYGILPWLLFYLWRINKKFNLVIYIGALILLLLLEKLTLGKLDLIGIPGTIRCWLECILGIITYKIYDRRDDRNYLNLNLLAPSAIVWIIGGMHLSISSSRSLLDLLILPAFSLLILAVATQPSHWIAKFLSWRSLVALGTISYSTYLVHWFLSALFGTFWTYKFHTAFGSNMSNWELWGTLGIYLAATLGIALLTYTFIELPMRDLLKPKACEKA